MIDGKEGNVVRKLLAAGICVVCFGPSLASAPANASNKSNVQAPRTGTRGPLQPAAARRAHSRRPASTPTCTGNAENGFVGGGESNVAAGPDSAVLGGNSNDACGDTDSIAGGAFNGIAASVRSSFIGGGDANANNATYAFIGTGELNIQYGDESFIGAGNAKTLNPVGTRS